MIGRIYVDFFNLKGEQIAADKIGIPWKQGEIPRGEKLYRMVANKVLDCSNLTKNGEDLCVRVSLRTRFEGGNSTTLAEYSFLKIFECDWAEMLSGENQYDEFFRTSRRPSIRKTDKFYSLRSLLDRLIRNLGIFQGLAPLLK